MIPMAIEYVTNCPGCAMPLTRAQAQEVYCYSCRRPLNEVIAGFIPRRCNACGAVMPTEAVNCPTCGSTKRERFSAAVEGMREAIGRRIPEGRDLPEPLRSELRNAGGAPAGWHVSELYISDEMADYIISQVFNSLCANVDLFTFRQAFGVGISFALSEDDQRTARSLVRRFFHVHKM